MEPYYAERSLMGSVAHRPNNLHLRMLPIRREFIYVRGRLSRAF